MVRECDYPKCKQKPAIKSRKTWVDYTTGKTYIFCPGCYARAKKLRFQGLVFGAGLGKRKFDKVKDLKQKNRRKYYQEQRKNKNANVGVQSERKDGITRANSGSV